MRELSYTWPQIWVAILFAAITVLLVALFAGIARTSRREVPFEEVKRVGYQVRTWWLWSLGGVLTAGVVVSLFFLPYSGARGATGKAQEVRVTGGQFYWSASPRTVRAGHVRFLVSAADVTHALGLYGPKGELLGSVQAMPGYTNKLDVQLDKPGEYLFSCLELCGIGHHRMHLVFRVSGR